MNAKMYVLSTLVLVVGVMLPIIVGYLDVSGGLSRPMITTTITITTGAEHSATTSYTVNGVRSTTLVGNGESRFIVLEEGYESIIEFIESNRKALTEMQQILLHQYTGRGFFDTRISIPAPTHRILHPVRVMEARHPSVEVSKTNVQVEGVDEADIVKTNGRIIAIAVRDRVYIFDVVNRRISSVINITTAYGDAVVKGLYLYGEARLVVIASHPQSISAILQLRTGDSIINISVQKALEATVIKVFDVSDMYRPTLLKSINVSASYLNSRLLDRHLYIIATESIYDEIGNYTIPIVDGRPVDPIRITVVDELPTVYTIILAINLDSMEYSVASYMTSYGSRIYMSRNGNLYIGSPIQIHQKLYLDMAIKFIEASLGYLPTNVRIVVDRYMEEKDYFSAYRYIVDYLLSLDREDAISIIERIDGELSRVNYSYTDITKFYVYHVNGGDIRYRGVFSVDGSLLDQFCMEEYGGRYFIVATTSTKYSIRYGTSAFEYEPLPMHREVEAVVCVDSKCTTTTIPITRKEHRFGKIVLQPTLVTVSTSNNVYIIDLEDLEIVGSLKGLAEGERIYAGRLIKNIFFLVTFRQVDPLFAIDVMEPTHPVVLGYLKIPGFSEYLHPVSGDLLLGVGLEDGALKISIFNVSNPSSMAEVSLIKIGYTWSPALQDHHAVTIYPARNISVIPAHIGFGAKQGFIILSYADAKLSLKDIVDHTDPLRSVYIGSKLFTISSTAIKIYDLDRERIEWEVRIG